MEKVTQRTKETVASNFKHSVKVPQFYKNAANILKSYENYDGSLKTLVFNSKARTNINGLYALLNKLLENQTLLKSAIAASNLLADQPQFDIHLAQVFAAQLLSKGPLEGNSKPVMVFKKYQDKIKMIASKGYNVKEKSALPCYVRVNTLVASVNEVHAQLEYEGCIFKDYDPVTYDDFLDCVKNLAFPYYMIDYHIPELLIFPPRTPFYNSILYQNNAIILQNKASCLPAFVSNIKENSNVIDACASPGNKTSHIAAKMNGIGNIVAVELDGGRFTSMSELLHSRQVKCVTPMHEDFLNLEPKSYNNVEHIFVDPTCSGSGTDYRKDGDSKKQLESLSRLQAFLLKRALSFPSVQEVIYSTCSINEEENENVVGRALERYHNKFDLEDLSYYVKDWKHFGSDKYSFGHKCLKTDVDIDRCTGFFVAKFIRKQESNGEEKCQESQDSPNEEEKGNSVKEIGSSIDTAEEQCSEIKGKRKKSMSESEAQCSEIKSKKKKKSVAEAQCSKIKSKKKKMKAAIEAQSSEINGMEEMKSCAEADCSEIKKKKKKKSVTKVGKKLIKNQKKDESVTKSSKKKNVGIA